MHTTKLWGTNPALALAIHGSGTCDSWLALVRRIGFVTSRGWAQHIVDR